MNGVHDMGGMHGLGPIEHEKDEPVFHAPWEGRVLALNLAAAALGKWNIDYGRHMRERIPPADYLRMSYYEKWLEGLITALVERGFATREEIESGRPDPRFHGDGSAKARPLSADRMMAMLAKGKRFDRPPGGTSSREVPVAPRFVPGQRVRARNIHPAGHTRLPRYARGKLGTVARDRGVYVFPDSNAHFQGERPQHLYSVCFSARELWGEEASPRDSVYLDLWDEHLKLA